MIMMIKKITKLIIEGGAKIVQPHLLFKKMASNKFFKSRNQRYVQSQYKEEDDYFCFMACVASIIDYQQRLAKEIIIGEIEA